jgi:hypothetical protein
MWWAGAGLLAAGNVVIGRREEGDKPEGTMDLDRNDKEGQVLLGEGVGQAVPVGLGEELVGEETTKEAVRKGRRT